MAAADPRWMGACELAAAVENRKLGSEAAVHEHLRSIDRVDGRIHAYVHVDRDARPARSGALAGVTVAVKDTIPVASMPWTFGTRSWQGRIADRDAIPVARLRAAGAALLGKTNTPELAASVGTVNEIFPATENPWRPGFTPGGSSGGSAAAVAAGIATVALGDDYGGSVRIPASCCGVVGLRPSTGLVGQEVPDPGHLNSRGPLARRVADVALLLQVMTGGAAAAGIGKKARIGVARTSTLDVNPAAWAACWRAADALDLAGHRLEPIGWEPEAVAEGYRTVRRVSVASFPGNPEDFGDGVRHLMREGRTIRGIDYFLAHQRATAAAWRGVNRLLESEFDAILTPTLGQLPMPIPQVPTFLGRDWDGYTQFVLPVSFSGLPAISVPAGLHEGLPVGVQLVGRHLQERDLLQLAAELEASPGFGFVKPTGL